MDPPLLSPLTVAFRFISLASQWKGRVLMMRFLVFHLLPSSLGKRAVGNSRFFNRGKVRESNKSSPTDPGFGRGKED